ncbi:MAG: SDR family oxidoreductase [Alphaproteobacteria bacterium]|nr:SDR family oxidoreductase [Alphaproteobacteria bacterium]
MRALVTGAGQRVGQAIAVELARQGASVAVHYRTSRAGAERTVAACTEAGGEAWLVQGDLSRTAECRAVVDAVRGRWDTLDVLVNNASAFTAVPFEEVSLDHLDAMLALHVRAPFLLVQGLLPLLRAGGVTEARAPGEGGVVVNLHDVGADRPLPGHAAYSVSKAALAMLTRALAVELAPAVRAVGVSPGQVAWPPDYDEARRERIAARIPMGRVGTPEDVARLVRFVVCEAPYLNGVDVPVDGGLSSRY